MPRRTSTYWTYLYFFQSSVAPYLVKIGHSTRPHQRLKDLGIGSPVPLIPVCLIKANVMAEEILHWAFADQWAHGEWYQPHQNLKLLVRGWKGEREHLLTPDVAERTIPPLATYGGPWPRASTIHDWLRSYRESFEVDGIGRRSRSATRPVLAWRNAKV